MATEPIDDIFVVESLSPRFVLRTTLDPGYRENKGWNWSGRPLRCAICHIVKSAVTKVVRSLLR